MRFKKFLIEKQELGLINTLISGLRFLSLDPKQVHPIFKKIPGAKKKQCFNNAFSALSGAPGEKYVLGYMFYLGVPIEHAWIKRGEQHFDVTIDPSDGKHTYYSLIELSFDEVYEYVDVHHHAPDLFSYNKFKHKK